MTKDLLTKIKRRKNRKIFLENTLFFSLSPLPLIIIILQFNITELRFNNYSHLIITISTSLLLLHLLLLLLYPNLLLFFKKILTKIIKFLGELISTLILSVIYIATLPLAKSIGRRNFKKNYTELSPWLKKNEEWRVNTFTPKTLNLKKRSLPLTLISLLISKRNYFLLVITILLLLISTIILASQSSVIAPFIYTFI